MSRVLSQENETVIVYTDKHRVAFQIDPDDYGTVMRYSWAIFKGYPYTNIGRRPTVRSVPLHVFLMGPAGDGLEWDHRDRDRLNNMRANLRRATPLIQGRNKSLRSDNRSGVCGVTFHTPTRRWQAHIGVGSGGRRHLGLYATIEQARTARLTAERELWGPNR